MITAKLTPDGIWFLSKVSYTDTNQLESCELADIVSLVVSLADEVEHVVEAEAFRGLYLAEQLGLVEVATD